MASPTALGFHTQKMIQEQERVHLRIAYGTKASTPQIRNERRMNPLNYYNPLPDNSSGSKIRPFFSSKDESGRPNAMEIVAMNQSKMSGGVLKDYRYARKVLDQRARDTTNMELESQGLPPVPSPILQLDEVESRILELSTLLSGINDAIDDGDISQLTVNELKNIPRLLIAIAPALTQSQIVEMDRYIDDIILSLTSAETKSAPVKRASSRIKSFLQTRVKGFLKALLDIATIAPADKLNAIRGFAKTFFDVKPEKKKEIAEVVPVAEEAEEEAPPPRRPLRPILAPPAEGAEGAEEAEEAPAEAPTEFDGLTEQQFNTLRREVIQALNAPSFRDLNAETIRTLYQRLPGSQAERITNATVAQLRASLVRRINSLKFVNKSVRNFNRWYNEQFVPNQDNLE